MRVTFIRTSDIYSAMRPDGRQPDEMREVRILPNYQRNAYGSALIEMGRTRVICSASVIESVPEWMKGQGYGWLTAEYSMLPGSSTTRIFRDRGHVNGRSKEIERLIGRSLRASLDMKRLGERTIWIDCDVVDADGGTRTASITGGFVALYLAVNRLMSEGLISESPIVRQVAAVSVGIVNGQERLDLCYQEDSVAQVDMNVVMDHGGNLIEVQATAERGTFTLDQMGKLLELASKGISELIEKQREVLKIVQDDRRFLP